MKGAILMPMVLSALFAFVSCNTRKTEPTAVLQPPVNSQGYKEVTVSGINLQWKADGAVLHVKLNAPSTGWVAVGFDPQPNSGMLGSNFIIGYVLNDTVHIRDDYGSSNYSHSSDVGGGGTDDVSNRSGSEAGGVTSLSFDIPLNSGDSRDRPISVGQSYTILLAYGPGGADDFTSQHQVRTSLLLEI